MIMIIIMIMNHINDNDNHSDNNEYLQWWCNKIMIMIIMINFDYN